MSKDYLTMARIMAREWKEYQRKEVWGKGYTGFTEIAIKNAFETAFMAGFSGRYFNNEEN